MSHVLALIDEEWTLAFRVIISMLAVFISLIVAPGDYAEEEDEDAQSSDSETPPPHFHLYYDHTYVNGFLINSDSCTISTYFIALEWQAP